MELSQTKTKEAKKLGVPVQYMVMADLCLLGYTEADAYAIAYAADNAMLSAAQSRNVMDGIFRSAKYKKTYAARAAAHSATVRSADGDDEKLLDKIQTARLIMRAAMKQPSDSKERIEGLMKYSDLMGYKRDDVEDPGEDCIHFFLPLKCDMCPLLQAFNESRESHSEAIKPVEMGNTISKGTKSPQNG